MADNNNNGDPRPPPRSSHGPPPKSSSKKSNDPRAPSPPKSSTAPPKSLSAPPKSSTAVSAPPKSSSAASSSSAAATSSIVDRALESIKTMENRLRRKNYETLHLTFTEKKIKYILDDYPKKIEKMITILKDKSVEPINKEFTFKWLMVYMFALFLQCEIYDSGEAYNRLLDKLKEKKLIIEPTTINKIITSFPNVKGVRASLDNYNTLYEILFTKLDFPITTAKSRDTILKLNKIMTDYKFYKEKDLTGIYNVVEKAKTIEFPAINKILEDMSGGSYTPQRKNRNVTKKRTRK